MEEYTREFHQYQIPCAQILLNRSDFEDRRRYKNIFSSISVLLNRGAVPVINENDTIAIEELKLGDNDTLSAQVAAMMHADLLVLLTDIDGLYTANPSRDATARHIDVVEKVTDELIRGAGGAGSSNGTGGMRTKLTAARTGHPRGRSCFYLLVEGKGIACGSCERNGPRHLFQSAASQHEDPSSVDGVLCAEYGKSLCGRRGGGRPAEV